MKQEHQNLAMLIRLAIDGELTTEQRRELRTILRAQPAAQDAVDFESKLQSAVEHAMLDYGEVPEGLALRIQQILSGESIADATNATVSLSDIESPARKDVIGTINAESSTGHASKRLIPSGLAAGILVLVTASIVIGIVGNRNKQTPPTLPGVVKVAETIIENQRNTDRNLEALKDWRKVDTDSIDRTLRSILGVDRVYIPDLTTVGCGLNEFRIDTSWTAGGSPVQLRYRCIQPDESVVPPSIRIVPTKELDSIFAKELNAYTGYRIATDAYSISDIEHQGSCYAWIKGDLAYFLWVQKDHDGLNYALIAGMPDGEIITLP